LLGGKFGDFSVFGKLGPELQLRAICVMRHVCPPLKYGDPRYGASSIASPIARRVPLPNG
jgi:hypothetical protein